MTDRDHPLVYIALVNWNGWKNTIECLESVFRLDYPNFKVVICDNASTDDSIARICDWAEGRLPAGCTNPQLQPLSTPPISKPIPYGIFAPDQYLCDEERVPLALIEGGRNLGFAGGCNVGVRYALAAPECAYVWLLNNDTVVEPQSLTAMVDLMQRDPTFGMCGSLCLYYNNPEFVQAAGGMRVSHWTGRVQPPRTRRRAELGAYVGPHIDYVNGASLMLSRVCLKEIGLLNESYFLYFEEMDLALRCKGKFGLAYTLESVVYHKQGGSAGPTGERKLRSTNSERFLTRSRLLIGRRFYPLRFPLYLCATLAAAVHRLLFGPRRNGWVMLKAIWESLHVKLIPFDRG